MKKLVLVQISSVRPQISQIALKCMYNIALKAYVT